MLMTWGKILATKNSRIFHQHLKPVTDSFKIRHRHTCGEMIFTVPVILTSDVELQAILTVETSLDVDVQLLNP